MQMKNLMNPSHQTFATTFIGEAYPPCTNPISSLAPITLRELKLETHHRGRVLIVRTFGIPTRLSAIQSAIEDENKDVDHLAIQNLPLTAVTEKVLPSGAIVAIKEPYYKITADGGVMIRVDHPSDFLHLESGDALVPVRLRSIPGQNKQDKTSTQLKENGNPPGVVIGRRLQTIIPRPWVCAKMRRRICDAFSIATVPMLACIWVIMSGRSMMP